RWRSTALRSATGPPAIDAGRVFGAARADQTVVALDAATGALVWSAGDTRGLGGQVRAAGGLVAAVVGEAVQPTSGAPRQFRGALLGLDAATGALRWRHPVPEYPRMLVAGDPLVVAYEATVAALDPASGAIRWGPVAPSPGAVGRLISAGDALYVTSDGGVQALDAADGTLRWSTGGLAPLALAVSDDLVLVGGADATVRALDALTGAARWQTPVGMPVGRLGVGAGLLLAGTWDGVVALDPETGLVRWFWHHPQDLRAQPVARR
ncbi:MAG TPA: PQQ-binding-like beta-propeller repeat protein, partial [Egibacteraceae bacterium]|nr:PQQ-binding-like beta-propeller repeat protein [Egibacteraceae bacterium]